MLRENPVIYEEAPKDDILLKVIKWLFIMEDIIYWHYEGRAFLNNFFAYVINEVGILLARWTKKLLITQSDIRVNISLS